MVGSLALSQLVGNATFPKARQAQIEDRIRDAKRRGRFKD